MRWKILTLFGNAGLTRPGKNGELYENGYWLLPFLTFQADCPYLVGSYAEIGAKLRCFAEMNVGTIILDVVAERARA
jgi:alkanesulfonate monooxygenase